MASSGKPAGALPNPYAKALPNPYAAATAAELGPTKSSEEQAKAEQKKIPAFHNPHHIRRPQAKGPAIKKPQVARPQMATSSSSDHAPAATATAVVQQPSLDWWRSTADDDAAALEYKRGQDRMQKEKKKQERKFTKQFGWWKGEAPYKADRPSNLRAYKASGSYRYKLDSFADYIKSHTPPAQLPKAAIGPSSDAPSASPTTTGPATTVAKPSFAPPASYDHDRTSTVPDNNDPYTHRQQLSHQFNEAVQSSPTPPHAPVPYSTVPPPPQPPAPHANVPPPPPPPIESSANIPPPPPPASAPPPPVSAPYNPTISAPPVRYNPTISAPPVRYDHATISAPPVRYNVTDKLDEPHQEERPAKRAKLSKAEAMMAKMGYKKGEGLGKNSDGITTHLEVKARKKEKDNRNFDPSEDYDENGKVIKSQQVFDILGGRITKPKEPDRFGTESKVIVAWGCVDGIDWNADAERDDGGVRQEMGQAFDDKFGRVERVYVNLSGEEQSVYVKFASELSALNAVNRFHEGYQFRGRNIRARYYNEAKFEASVFDH